MQASGQTATQQVGEAAQAPAVAGAASAQSVFEAARASRNELKRQLDALISQRHDFLRELEDHQVEGPATTGMQTRITQLDARIAKLDLDIAAADAAVAAAAAVPGAVVEQPPGFMRNGPPEALMYMIPTFMFVAFMPIVIAVTRRIWRRGNAPVQAALPSDLADRLSRLEAMGETTALEVERIGEGQRFVTRLLTERGERALP
jgi:hypothetical protein